ncbi:hypothetical protein EMIHUDRAFT_229685 [Emiliania huxleyi CCMP1516]|uniref:F-box domain-containing protein n=2 Tax=Emiliania huxleyi TaxID=2903 RepID=A0A0D3KCP2_EMIH1|nr:hypothetical protein EMIHUDRAFT_229685 [Emiliania huxleyi CCMP1516]EOD33527.1 hypothetical protein EMIHUDRAFT_229685 [Emiliania huxleyi CCMP1516]|eukprot:XP_005785956.1 hypothetical protein EMIHUDRAFT_229685 [Emiliania huxleyi CCMP1516]
MLATHTAKAESERTATSRDMTTTPLVTGDMTLLSLPNDLLARLLASLPHSEDLARCSCVSTTFAQLTLMALRDRAGGAAGNFGIQALLWEERRQRFGRHRCAVAAAWYHCVFVSNGQLRLSGQQSLGGPEDEEPPYCILGQGSEAKFGLPRQIDLGAVSIRCVAAAHSHTLAVSANGEVYAWGEPSHGRLGMGEVDGDWVIEPRKVEALSNVALVSACEGTSLALTNDGVLYSWGDAGFGQLGLSEQAVQQAPGYVDADPFRFVSVPQRVSALDEHRIVGAAMAPCTAAAWTTSGACFVWGLPENRELPGISASAGVQHLPAPIKGLPPGVSDLQRPDAVTPFLAKIDLPGICAISSCPPSGEILLSETGDAYFVRYWPGYGSESAPSLPFLDARLDLYVGLGEIICEPLKLDGVNRARAAACSEIGLFTIACQDDTFYSFGADNVGCLAALGQGIEEGPPGDNDNPLLTFGQVLPA